jgi:hypothetical protein
MQKLQLLVKGHLEQYIIQHQVLVLYDDEEMLSLEKYL